MITLQSIRDYFSMDYNSSAKIEVSSGFKIYKTGDGWRWQLKARNGEIVIASTEGFSSKYNAKRNFKRAVELMSKVVV